LAPQALPSARQHIPTQRFEQQSLASEQSTPSPIQASRQVPEISSQTPEQQSESSVQLKSVGTQQTPLLQLFEQQSALSAQCVPSARQPATQTCAYSSQKPEQHSPSSTHAAPGSSQQREIVPSQTPEQQSSASAHSVPDGRHSSTHVLV
jgi:hypothetical protein